MATDGEPGTGQAMQSIKLISGRNAWARKTLELPQLAVGTVLRLERMRGQWSNGKGKQQRSAPPPSELCLWGYCFEYLVQSHDMRPTRRLLQTARQGHWGSILWVAQEFLKNYLLERYARVWFLRAALTDCSRRHLPTAHKCCREGDAAPRKHPQLRAIPRSWGAADSKNFLSS